MADESDLREEIESLKADLSNLRSDLADIAGALRDAGYSKAEEWRTSMGDEVGERREELRKILESLRERSQRTEEDFERRVGDNPWSSLLAALGVGFILAKVLDWGSRR